MKYRPKKHDDDKRAKGKMRGWALAAFTQCPHCGRSPTVK